MLTTRWLAPALVALAAASVTILVTACSPPPPADGGLDAASGDSSVDAADAADAADTSTDAGNPIKDRCERLFDAALAMAKRCGEGAGLELSGQAYHASDRPNYVGSCVAQASSSGYDPSRLDACLVEAEATTLCVDLLELDAPFNESFLFGGPSTLASCLQGPGALGAGARCAYGSQCASARCNTGGPSGGPTYCGTCAPPGAPLPAPAAVGQSCDATRPCVSGANCVGTICAAPGGDGELCPASKCAPGLACTDSAGGMRLCKPRSPLGASCAGGLYCQSPYWCIDNQCVKVRTGKLGDDCSFTPGNNVSCEAELTCRENPGTGTRSCISVQDVFGQVGETCNLPTSTKPCARSLWCVDHSCQQRDSNRCTATLADAGPTDAQPKDTGPSD